MTRAYKSWYIECDNWPESHLAGPFETREKARQFLYETRKHHPRGSYKITSIDSYWIDRPLVTLTQYPQ